MKDRRTKADLIEAWSLAQNRISDLESALKTERSRAEAAASSKDRESRRADEAEKRERDLLSEKNETYDEKWRDSRTREYEYANALRFSERQVGILRGALVAIAGKQKADEIEGLVNSGAGICG